MDTGVTTTCAITWATVTSSVASLPSAEAWMVVVPFATAVTNPPCVTVAAAALLLVNKIATPGIAAPAASRGTAVGWGVSPPLGRKAPGAPGRGAGGTGR